MLKVLRCPYCVEGSNFKAMMGRAEGRWFLCARCGHVAVPEKPSYQCECANCAELERAERNQ
jgi:hypothetical protein